MMYESAASSKGLALALFAVVTLAMAHDNLKIVTKGNNDFTMKVFNEISKKHPGNLIYSPISVHTILSLLQQGAEGQTAKVMSDVLQIPELKTLSADGFQSLMSYLNGIQNVTLEIANKVYVKNDVTLKPSFSQIATNSFYSEAQALDFSQSEAAAKAINDWVSLKTHDKIKDLISPDSLNDLTRMVLVNAIYFKGDWANQFDKKFTTKDKFYTSKDNFVEVDMMHKTDNYKYGNNKQLDAKIIQLPYKNEDVNMVVILPNKIDGIDELQQKLTNYDLSKLTEGLYNTDVILSLPKFKIESTIDLNDPLKMVGLESLFLHPNLTGLLEGNENLKVSDVIQKAFIEVNEEGAEAAAATGVLVGLGSSLPKPIKDMFRADHPFVVTITTTTDGAKHTLFIGRVIKF
ncbi:PREDICTED: antichymotrypsin-2-like isoform X7 [Nicrophorus vespilloides]|uniref:Antichymotrypsin-2-like isoform X7 n=1 Tax=Nicrophorus vespilloides TaxID=110193 RepID=A0ABM1M077_NICVS|nr:PREDICTED: antichymotrypsin-2-like isoform X7 [Nicrophorus vespilloides]